MTPELNVYLDLCILYVINPKLKVIKFQKYNKISSLDQILKRKPLYLCHIQYVYDDLVQCNNTTALIYCL